MNVLDTCLWAVSADESASARAGGCSMERARRPVVAVWYIVLLTETTRSQINGARDTASS